MNMNEEMLDIVDIIKYFIVKLKIIIIITLLVMIAGNIYSLSKSKKYSSSTMVTIPSDIATYAEIVKSDSVLENTINELNMSNITTKQLAGYVTTSVTSGTKLLNIKVTTDDAAKSQMIANKITDEFVEYLREEIKLKNVKINKTASFSIKPDESNKKKEQAIYFIGGAFLGCAVVFAMYMLDNKVKTKKDVEEKLKSTLIGLILIENNKENSSNKKEEKNKIINKENDKNIKEIVKNINYNVVGKIPKIINITSIENKEGKTYLTNKLAEKYSKDKQKVLIIKADLKNAEESAIINKGGKEKEAFGYSNLILDYKSNLKLDKYIQKVNTNIDIIYNTEVVANQEELINSENNEKLINRLAKKYDVIIIDNGLAEESKAISKYSNVNILVVNYNKVRTDKAIEVINQYKEQNIKLSGIVLNKVK